MLSILVCHSYFLRFDQKQQQRAKPYPPLASLQVYTGAGSMVESANDSASRSPQYGSWERVAGHISSRSARGSGARGQMKASMGSGLPKRGERERNERL